VAGVGLANIDDVEGDTVGETLRHPLHMFELLHEDRAGDAAELDHDRLLAPQRRQLNRISVQVIGGRVDGRSANLHSPLLLPGDVVLEGEMRVVVGACPILPLVESLSNPHVVAQGRLGLIIAFWRGFNGFERENPETRSGIVHIGQPDIFRARARSPAAARIRRRRGSTRLPHTPTRSPRRSSV
jgi:hypothetical protein